MSRHRGRVCHALAKKLQQQIPELLHYELDRTVRKIPLLWLAENLYPATGYYRTDWRADVWRWEGTCLAVREDGTTYNLWMVGGYTTMSELIKPGRLEIDKGGEVTNVPRYRAKLLKQGQS